MLFVWSAFVGGLFFGLLFTTFMFWLRRQGAKTNPPQMKVSVRTLVWVYPIMLGLIMGAVRAGIGYVINDVELIQGSFAYGSGAVVGSLLSMLVFVRRWLSTS